MNFKLLSVILLLVGLGVGFFAGTRFQLRTNQSSSQFQLRTRFGGNGNLRPVRGQIISADDKSITIKMQDGSTKIILIPSSATILKTDKASISDLKKDETVVVFGTQNSDGSVTAKDIQLNPTVVLGSPQPTK